MKTKARFPNGNPSGSKGTTWVSSSLDTSSNYVPNRTVDDRSNDQQGETPQQKKVVRSEVHDERILYSVARIPKTLETYMENTKSVHGL